MLALTDGLGVDVSIEAVGYPETLQTAASLVRPGGTIANIGVHGTPVELPMQEMWIKNVTLTMGLVDTVSIPTLLRWWRAGASRPRRWARTPSRSTRSSEAYEVFGNAAAQRGAEGRDHDGLIIRTRRTVWAMARREEVPIRGRSATMRT